MPLLKAVILRVRPRRSARLYQRIWTDFGSPLLYGTNKLAAKIQESLDSQLDFPVHVAAGMRYGEPSISHSLRRLREFNVRNILVLPLFPQYSGTTTGSIIAAIFDEFHAWIKIPTLTIIRDYHDHSSYIRALAKNIENHTDNLSHLLISFHGIPSSYGKAGDPYEIQCKKTGALLAKKLGLKPEEWSLAFQSRFGPQEWLRPYTDQELARYGKQRSNISVVCPGFAVDCLETLDEIAHEGAQTFNDAGGRVFNYIPALNDQPFHVEALIEILLFHLNRGSRWN
jgi:ferrochelatase